MAHYVTGVLDRDSMPPTSSPATRVKTLRGSMRGVVVRVRQDGQVVWAPEGSRAELVAVPESLLRDKPAG